MSRLETQNPSLLIGSSSVVTNQLFQHEACYLKLNGLKMVLLVIRVAILFDAGKLRSETSLTTCLDTDLRHKVCRGRFSVRFDWKSFHFINVTPNQILLKREGLSFDNRKLDLHC